MVALAIVVVGTGWGRWVSLIGCLSLSLVYYVAFFDAFAEHPRCQHGCPWARVATLSPSSENRSPTGILAIAASSPAAASRTPAPSDS
jgi:hypothetical protein